mgnify:CR=1 FL=1
MSFTEHNVNGVIFDTAGTLSVGGVRHAFTTRHGGVSPAPFDSLNLASNRGDREENILENYRRLGAAVGFDASRAVGCRQIHSDLVRVAREEDAGKIRWDERPYDADALITNVPNLPLFAYGTDCCMITVYDPTSRSIAAIHAGWRGTASGIVLKAAVTMMSYYGADPYTLRAAIGPKTSAVIINTPNNPVGAVYTRESLEALGAMLREREEALGRPLYLISDEPYREITYGIEVPWVPSIYARTIVCYSYSKALSLPGERIGWVYVSDAADDGDAVAVAVAGAGRALGYVCAPVLLQRVAARCVGEPSDVAAYAENRRLLTEGLSALGYEYVEPDGAFYLWVRALEEDAQAFSDRAKEYELLIVPSDSFGVGGWVRLSYCIARDTIERSMPAFKALKESYEAKLSS